MIYVLSDIHGNAKNFDAILQQICLQPEDILYILGDVIDRHPDGIRILRKIMSMPTTSNIYKKVSAQKLLRIWRHFPSTSILR